MNALTIAWLRGRFLCLADGRTWEAPAPVSSWPELAAALRDGAARLGFRGRRAFLVLDHAAFQHRMEFTPALTDRALGAYFGRMLAREEQEPVWWSAQRAAHGRGHHLALLHTAPQEWVEELIRIFAGHRLTLERLMPVTALLEQALGPLAPAEPFLLGAVEFGGWTSALATGPDRKMVFGRSFRANWKSEPERLGMELNRSWAFAKQHCGVAPRVIHLFGETEAGAVRRRCAAAETLTVGSLPLESWLGAAARIPTGDPRNLLSSRRRQRRSRAWLRAVAAAACWTALALYALGGWSRAAARRTEREQFQALRRQVETMRGQRTALAQRNRTVAAQRQYLAEFAALRLPPVPPRFLAYCAAVAPADLRLRDFAVEWTGAEWRFTASGFVERRGDAAASVADWRSRLQQPPWRVRFAADAAGAGAAAADFRVEGGLLEN